MGETLPVQSIILKGTAGVVVDIECRLSNNLPTIVIVGSANRAVGEARERIRGAFATSHIMLPRKRITVNLAPADIPKGDSGFDLAIAVAILSASRQIQLEAQTAKTTAYIGELGLNGSTRAVRGIIGKLLAGRAKDITTFYIPAANLEQARLVPNIRLVPVADLSQLYQYLAGHAPYTSLATGAGAYEMPQSETSDRRPQLSEIVGQAQAKRALEITAAGGHNVFFDGPPGTGKSMLAKALPSLLPPLDREEIVEVTQLYSLASNDYEKIVTVRPFRAPHHSTSRTAVIGGGGQLRPGEISLAHRGVLFFDELPEFGRETLEALRQPLESRIIGITRANGTANYPANFIFVATANPCPCGYRGSGRACTCLSSQIAAYRGRLSGPILDRIDLYSSVHHVEHERLLTQSINTASDDAVRRRITDARRLQARRFGGIKLNAAMTNQEIKQLRLDNQARRTLNLAAHTLNVSARAYMRTVKVAQTIADLDTSTIITGAHITEALTYRPDFHAEKA